MSRAACSAAFLPCAAWPLARSGLRDAACGGSGGGTAFLPTTGAPRRARPARRQRAALRPPPPAMVWVERAASVVVETPVTDAYDAYIDLEAMPSWSPWLRRVERDDGDPMLSRWFLGARGFEFSWLARIIENDPCRVIRWVSESGLSNRGTVSFHVEQEAQTRITLAIEFDVPNAIAGAVRNDFIGKFVESTLEEDLKRFRGVLLSENRRRRFARAAPAIEKEQEKSG